MVAVEATVPSEVDDIEVVGEAGNGDEAIAQTKELVPAVILMDLKMPGTNGIEATRRIHEMDPNIGILVLTMFDDDDSVFAAMRAGARGYVLKGEEGEETIRAIRAVGRGEAVFSPSIARRVMQFFATPIQPPQSPPFPTLTDREREILGLMAQGQSNPSIAARLALSVKTVQNYVSSIFNKLQVADRAEAIVRAREAGMGDARGTRDRGDSGD